MGRRGGLAPEAPAALFSAAVRELAGAGAVYNDPQVLVELNRQVSSAVDERLEVAMGRAREVSADLVITQERALDGAAGRLVDLSSHADTIVLGRSGHGFVVGAVLGSVARQVATHAQCPVVVVHEANGRTPAARGGVVGVDGSPVSVLALGTPSSRRRCGA